MATKQAASTSTVEIQRFLIINNFFVETFKKVTKQDMKLSVRERVTEFRDAYQKELDKYKEFLDIYSKTEDGSAQLKEYLNSPITIPSLPACLLKDENVLLSSDDESFLRPVVSE